MKILGIVGSPRKGGNTDVLIDRVLEGAASKDAEVEKLYLRDVNIHPCQGGFSCEVVKKCVIPDDMVKVSAKLQEAAAIVVGTPIYMGNVSAPCLNFLVRCRQFISYIDVIGSALAPAEVKRLLEERTCFHLWKNVKPYSELPSSVEEAMLNGFKSYFENKQSSHPAPTKRLEKGKKGVIVLCYHQHGEHIYQAMIDFLVLNLKSFWGLEIADIIPAYGMLKKGDAQKREDLMERSFKAGQLIGTH